MTRMPDSLFFFCCWEQFASIGWSVIHNIKLLLQNSFMFVIKSYYLLDQNISLIILSSTKRSSETNMMLTVLFSHQFHWATMSGWPGKLVLS